MTHKKRLFIASIAAALVAAAVLLTVTASSANASATACPVWVVRSIANGASTWGTVVDSSQIVNADSVRVAKPNSGDAGTEASTTDANVDLSAPANITVHYSLSDEADFAAGAIRMFYYDTPGADTLTVAPTAFVAADARDGTLTLHDVSGHVGRLGVVYDASNSAGGSVTFSDLMIGDTAVKFTSAPCAPPPVIVPTTPVAHPTTHAPASSTQTGGRSTTGHKPTTAANNDVYPAVVPSASASASVAPSEQDFTSVPDETVSASPSDKPIAEAPVMKKTSHTGWKLTGLGAIALGIVLLAGLAVARRRTDHGNDDTQYISRHQ